MANYKLLINGELVDGASTMEVINPATETVLALCPRADEAPVTSTCLLASIAPRSIASPLQRSPSMSRG